MEKVVLWKDYLSQAIFYIFQNMKYKHIKSTTDWVAHEQQKCISHSSGAWRSEVRVPARLGGIFQVAAFPLLPPPAQGASEFSLVSLWCLVCEDCSVQSSSRGSPSQCQ